MDRNLLLAFVLSFLVLWVWTTLIDPPPPPDPRAQPQEHTTAPVPEGVGMLPETDEVSELPTTASPLTASPEPVAQGRRIPVETDLFRAELDTLGGAIAHWELKQFSHSKHDGGEAIELTTGREPYARALVTPFSELGPGDLSNAVFDVEIENPTEIAVRLVRDGISIRKHYRFEPDSYAFQLTLEVRNDSEAEIRPRFAVVWPAAVASGNDFIEQSFVALVDGSLEKTPVNGIDDVEKFEVGPVEWAGVDTPYFVSALVADHPSQARARFQPTAPDEAGVAILYFNPTPLPPGKSAERVFRGYMGPKEAARLEAIGGDLSRSIDLGWSWIAPFTRFFSSVLETIVTFVPGRNYGWAIIILTILVRAVTTPLTVRQMRSMERMRRLQPKITELREKYGDDRQKQSEEMMRLYRQEGVNPLGGCFPMLLQLPVFIGLFWALRSSISLRQASFIGWIDDLSAPDSLFEIPGVGIPFRLLPIVMAATMVLQQRITPMQGGMDPTQQKMMMTMMPIVMLVVCYQFPSGLVLYWMVSNVLAIAHQLWIGRSVK